MVSFADWRVGEDGRLGPVLKDCLHAAIAAPSIHNTQPWRFGLRADGVDVFADHTRRLGVLDPSGREVLISVGAALLNLRIAVLAHGRTPLTRMMPDGGDSNRIAQVTFGPPVHVSETVRALAQAIPRRRTNRRPFSSASVPPEVLAELVDSAAAEGGRLVVADAGTCDAVLGLVRLAERRERGEPAYWLELSDWTKRWPHRCDGIPPEAFGPWSGMETVPIRDFGLVEPAQRRRMATFEEEPTIALLYSTGDTPRHWVVAGQALERALLTATVRGVANTLMTQPMEIPRLRELLVDSAAALVPQAIVRFGYGPPSAPTPRRPLEEVVDGLLPQVRTEPTATLGGRRRGEERDHGGGAIRIDDSRGGVGDAHLSRP